MKAFGLHLREVRTLKKITQEDLAYNSGLHLSQIGRIERGEQNATISTVFVLAQTLGIDPKKLFDFEFSPSGGRG
jgi:transcriptional regulator with XRE-family HTH domain